MYKLIKPLLFKFDPEKAHGMTIDALKLGQNALLLPIMHKIFNYEDPSLTQTIKGITFNNPIGLAALTNLAKYLKHLKMLASVHLN